jgi:glucose/arabinose dehydrogenase
VDRVVLQTCATSDYAKNGWIYITYASEGEGTGGNTKLIRAKLVDGGLTQIESLYKATPNTTKGQHFGSRIVFDNDGYLYFSIGERAFCKPTRP